MLYRFNPLRSFNINRIIFQIVRNSSSKVPANPGKVLEKNQDQKVVVDKQTLALLERFSLVKCDTAEGVKVLEDSIAFANKILDINTDDVQPLYSVLENENLFLRLDLITQGNCQKDILKNASLKEDDYFVAPPGNIPLHELEKKEIETKVSSKHENRDTKCFKSNWLQSVNTKTSKHLPVYTVENFAEGNTKVLPFGFIANHVVKHDESAVLKYDIDGCAPKNSSQLQLNLIVPQHTSMQYFIQWQRYRKYWWSSVTTTPSLFAINEIKYEEEMTNANIVAQFPWGLHTVETISMTSRGMEQNSSHLKCSMLLESAMFILLLDGLMNKRESKYLKLHKKMAPYKICFALNEKDTINKTNINELIYLMHQRLKAKDISSCLPDFTLSLEQQIKENLQLGVTYTAILCDNTLINGIFHLLNSSTMLKEEVHVADFDFYAALICGK